MSELISVIVPVYNVKKYLVECLESLLVQTHCPIEIVIVDDRSTDGSFEIAEQYAKGYSNITLVRHDRNRGLAAARNTGIDSAKGDYIAFVDSDDYVSPDYIMVLYKNLVKYDVDMSICGRYLAFESPAGIKLMQEGCSAYSYKCLSNRETIRALNCYRAFDMSMCSKLIKRELFKGVVFPEGLLCEDFYVCHQLAFKLHASYYDPIPLYYYRQRPGSISRNDSINWAPVDASDKQSDFIAKNCPDIKEVGITACVFARISMANEHARRGVSFSKEEEYKQYVRTNLRYVLLNQDISLKKKVQALCFGISPKLYVLLFLSFSKRAKLQKQSSKDVG